MKNTTYFPTLLFTLLLAFGLFNSVSGQKIKIFEPPTFEADAWRNTAPTIVPGQQGSFFYLQELFRARDSRWSGVWLVQVRPSKEAVFGQPSESLELVGQTPVDAPKEHRPTDLRLFRLNNALAAVGRLPDPHFDGPRTVVQFFDLSGKPKGPLQTLSCYFNEPTEGWWDTVMVAANNEKLLWWGENRQEAVNQRRPFVSVFADDGRLQWQRELKGFNPKDNYEIKSVALSTSNELWMLMEPFDKTINGNTQTMVQCFQPSKLAFSRKTIDWQAPVAYHSCLALDSLQQAVVGAVLSHSVSIGLRNRVHARPEQEEHWHRWALRRFSLKDSLTQTQSWEQELADTLLERYCMGADLLPSGFTFLQKQLVWSWEEEYETGSDITVKDLLFLSFGMENQPSLDWSAALFKTQGGKRSDTWLSFLGASTDKHLFALYSGLRDPYGTFRLWKIDRETGESDQSILQTPVPTGFRSSLSGGCFTDSRNFVVPLSGSRTEVGYRLLNLSALP